MSAAALDSTPVKPCQHKPNDQHVTQGTSIADRKRLLYGPL